VIIRVDRVISQFWRGNEYSDLCVSGNGMEWNEIWWRISGGDDCWLNEW
jgi:hypothetical protein